MDNSWELDGGLLARIDEYFESMGDLPKRESVKGSCSLRSQKRGRIIESPTDEVESNASDSDSPGNEEEYQPECIVCSEAFVDSTEVGVPMTCLHIFCYSCIKEWSNRTNVCPICKSEFNVLRRLKWQRFVEFVSSRHMNLSKVTMHARPQIKSFKTLKKKLLNCLTAIPSHIETVAQKSLHEEPEEAIGGCEVCGADDHWDELLLCDGCNLGYHIFCLDPPLQCIPNEDWFCKGCLEGQEPGIGATQDSMNGRGRLRSQRSDSIGSQQGFQNRRQSCEENIANSGQGQTTMQMEAKNGQAELQGGSAVPAETGARVSVRGPGQQNGPDRERNSTSAVASRGSVDVITIEDDEDGDFGDTNEQRDCVPHYMTPTAPRLSYFSMDSGVGSPMGTNTGSCRRDSYYSALSESQSYHNVSGSIPGAVQPRSSIEPLKNVRPNSQEMSQKNSGEKLVGGGPGSQGLDSNPGSSRSNREAKQTREYLFPNQATSQSEVNSQSIDDLFEERPKRKMSFIYQYRRLMEHEARTRSESSSRHSSLIKGSSLRYIF